MNRDLGQWILPQPTPKKKYVKIPELVKVHNVPFGYKRDEEEPGWFIPIPLELDALEKAKKHVKTYTYVAVAAWLTTTTGRSITPDGLKKRINSEAVRRRRVTAYRRLAKRYKEALAKAEKYEKFFNEGEQVDFFDSDEYCHIRDSDI